MQQEREQFEGQIATLEAENELLNETRRHLEKTNQELEDENRQLQQQNQELEEENRQLQQQNQELQQQLHVVLPSIPNYQSVRDRILKNWRVAKAPEKKERIMSALDRFIEAVTESTQISTPGEDHD